MTKEPLAVIDLDRHIDHGPFTNHVDALRALLMLRQQWGRRGAIVHADDAASMLDTLRGVSE